MHIGSGQEIIDILGLWKIHTTRRAVYFYTQKTMQIPKVFKSKSLLKLRDVRRNKGGIAASDDYIININQN